MTSVFLAAAAVLLPPQVAAPIAVLAALLRGRARRMSPGRVADAAVCLTLATLAAWAAAQACGGHLAALSMAAAVAYAVTAAGFGRLLGSNLFGGFGNQLLLASVGAIISALWTTDPWLTLLAVAPLVLLRRAQRLPHLQRDAQTDSKTGLLNTRRFSDELDSALARARTQARPLSVIAADLDLLREVNNQHGHLAGDAVIAGISEVLREQIRRGDLAARFGGEEFLIALPGTTPERAARIAERIREAVASRLFSCSEPAVALRATVSAGVASFPRDGRTARSILHEADLAVLAAKRRGRNRVVDAAELRRAAARPRTGWSPPESAFYTASA